MFCLSQLFLQTSSGYFSQPEFLGLRVSLYVNAVYLFQAMNPVINYYDVERFNFGFGLYDLMKMSENSCIPESYELVFSKDSTVM
jgi:hypothetical protein